MDLDERLLGQRLPGTPRDRERLLRVLEEMAIENGEQWVIDGRERLLMEAEWIIINQPQKRHLDVNKSLPK